MVPRVFRRQQARDGVLSMDLANSTIESHRSCPAQSEFFVRSFAVESARDERCTTHANLSTHNKFQGQVSSTKSYLFVNEKRREPAKMLINV